MNSSKNHVGINITDNRIQLVELVYKENKIYIGNADEEYFDRVPGFVLNENNLSETLLNSFDAITRRVGLLSTNVSFTLPNGLFKIAQVPVDPSLGKSELKEYINWEFSVLFPEINIEDMKINFLRVDESNFYISPQVIFFAVKSSVLRQLHEFSVRHNLAVRYVDNAHVSSQLLLKRKSFGEAELILLLFLEKNRLSFGIEIGGKMILFRIINFDDLDSLPDLFRNEMSQVKDLNPLFTNISRVFVCGEKEIEEIAERLFDDMNIDYETLNPFKNIPASEKIKPEIINENFSTFSAPAGIVFRPI